MRIRVFYFVEKVSRLPGRKEKVQGLRRPMTLTTLSEIKQMLQYLSICRWVGPSGDMCNVYGGFTCVDQAIASAGGDTACVDIPGGDTTFNGVTFTVGHSMLEVMGPCVDAY